MPVKRVHRTLVVTPLCARVKCIGGVALFRRLKAHGSESAHSPIPKLVAIFFSCLHSHETRGNGHGLTVTVGDGLSAREREGDSESALLIYA
jgi:hypothetical protein